MERLENWETYKGLLREARQRGFIRFSNNYLDMDAVKRYIQLGRTEYSLDGNGLYICTDEGAFYRMYLQCGQNEIKLPRRDKPVLVRNVFRQGEMSAAQKEVESQLQGLGFSLYDESVQILAKPLDFREDILAKQKRSERFLTRFGLNIFYSDSSRVEEIIWLRDHTPELKTYHFLYETMEERRQAAENGFFRCVSNAQGEICAAQQFYVKRNTIQGNWLAVKPEYKSKYGIGAAMAYHSFAYAIEHNINSYFGWVVRDNIESIRYHQSIGYEIMDKMANEWILM